MPTIPIELPDELHRFVEAKVQRGDFESASDYIVSLVDAARQERSAIEAALLESLQSGPAEEWTSREWADIKQRMVELDRRLAAHEQNPDSARFREMNSSVA